MDFPDQLLDSSDGLLCGLAKECTVALQVPQQLFASSIIRKQAEAASRFARAARFIRPCRKLIGKRKRI
jgi:hypothetical protein